MAYIDTTWYLNSVGYAAVAARPQNTAVVAGQIVRQFTAPAVGSERVFVCIVAGTTANVTDATWSLGRGAKTTDGTATWQECSGASAVNGDLTNTPTWATAKATAGTPSQGTIIKRNNGASYQICSTSSSGFGASEPAFSDTAGVTTTEVAGSTVWTSLGAVSNFTGGQAPHARLANVFGTNWFASGNTVYVGDNHAETVNAALTITPASALMARILCHNHSGSYPPTSSDLTTGATISNQFTSLFNISPQGSFYFYGIAFIAGVGGASSGQTLVINGTGTVGQVQNWCYFDNCSFQIAATGGTCYMQIGSGQAASWAVTIFSNTTVKFASTTQIINLNCGHLTWRNTGQILAAGSSVPVSLLQAQGVGLNVVTLEGLDLSQLTGNLITNALAGSIGNLAVKDCKLNAATAIPTPINTAQAVQLSRSDSAATAYKSSRSTYEGIESTETSIVRTGGYADPTGQAQSRKIITSANSQWLRPYKAQALAVWNGTVGSSKTVTVYGTVNAGALPNNDDIWMEVSYLGDAGTAALPSTWEAATVSSVNLSGGNLVATNTGTTSTNQGAHVPFTAGQTTGKYYFEVTLTTFTNGAGVGVGIGNASSTYTSMSSGPTYGCSCFVVGHTGTGTIFNPSGNVGLSLGALTSGDVIGVAVDVTNGKVWFRKGATGFWDSNGGHDPTNPTSGGGVTPLPAGAVVPFVTFGSGPAGAAGVAGNVFTANFGASAFVGAVPSGYTAGWPVVPAVPPMPKGSTATSGKAQVWSAGAAVPSDGSSWSTSYMTFDGTPSAGVVMSNGNLTVTHGASANSTGVTSNALLVAGKYYFEVTVVGTAGASHTIGIMKAGTPFTDASNNGTNCVCVVANGLIYVNAVSSGNIGSHTVGAVYGFAIDLDARLVWLRKNAGSWNNSGTANPVTGVGGAAMQTGSFAPYVSFFAGASTDAFTANFGQSSYANAAPSGFMNWGSIWSPFKLSTSITPQLPGYVIPVIKAAKAGVTYYIDPAVVVT